MGFSKEFIKRVFSKKEDEYKLHFIRSNTVCAFVIFIKNKYTDYAL